jgi:outer membrane immunogenic protein
MRSSLIAFLGGALSLSFGGVSAASAADIAPPPYIPSPTPVVTLVNDWSGFYGGGDVGGRWSNQSWNTTCLNQGIGGGVGCPLNLVVPNTPLFPTNNPASFNSTSVKAGIYAGYNWQVTSWVVGIEGDANWANNNKTIRGIPGTFNPATAGAPGLDTANVRQGWEGSLRIRTGYLLTPSVMLFTTGGVALTDVKASAFCGTAFPVGWCTGPAGPGSNLGTVSSASDTRVGWTVGAGVEFMVTGNWLVRGEYRYADYGRYNFILFPGAGVCGAACDTINANVNLQTHSAMIGVAFKFGGPMVARY